MNRRNFHRLALCTGTSLLSRLSWAQTGPTVSGPEKQNPWGSIEADSQGRLGVAVIDTQTGHLKGHRVDERFPMCSTFKWLAAAHVLQRVDQGIERLDRRMAFGRDVLLPWSPVTERYADGQGMTLGELCHATITTSDNAAGNLILRTLVAPRGSPVLCASMAIPPPAWTAGSRT